MLLKLVDSNPIGKPSKIIPVTAHIPPKTLPNHVVGVISPIFCKIIFEYNLNHLLNDLI